MLQDNVEEAQILNIPGRLWTPIAVEDLRFWFLNPGIRQSQVVYPMPWIDPLISFYPLSVCQSVCVSVNR